MAYGLPIGPMVSDLSRLACVRARVRVCGLPQFLVGVFCLPAPNFLLLTVRVCVRVAAGSGRVARLCCAGYCRVGCCFVTESLEAVLLYKVDGKGVVVDSETGWRCGGVAETDDPGPLFVGGYPLWLITPGVWFAGFDAAGNRVGVAGSRLDAARLVWEQWRLEKGLGL